MASVIYSGRVLQQKSRNNWKESWLSLDQTGLLKWKRRDAYQLKSTMNVRKMLDYVTIGGWPPNGVGGQSTPFWMQIPFETRGVKKLTVTTGQDLDLWLDAFATAVGHWKLWKAIKQRAAMKIANNKSISEHAVERLLPYKDLVQFYEKAWSEFLASYRHAPRREQADEDAMLPPPIEYQPNTSASSNGIPTPVRASAYNPEQVGWDDPCPRYSLVASQGVGKSLANGAVFPREPEQPEITDPEEELHF